MTVRLGDLQVAFYRRPWYERILGKLTGELPKNPSRVLRALDELCNLFSEASFKWYLVGGMGIDVHIGKITREHHDFDIEIPSESRHEFKAYMKSKDYSLFKRLAATDLPPDKRVVLFDACYENECVPEEERVKAAKTKDGVIVDGDFTHLSYLDVFFTRHTDEGTEFGFRGKISRLSFPQPLDYLIERNGNQIRLRNPVYEVALRQNSKHPVEQFDLNNLLRNLNTAAGNAYKAP
jgi:hypothetical protein